MITVCIHIMVCLNHIYIKFVFMYFANVGVMMPQAQVESVYVTAN